MNSNAAKDLIVFISPAGATRKVVNAIADRLTELRRQFEILDLGANNEQALKLSISDIFKDGGCLWVGSPIYTQHALPQITRFLSSLPQLKGRYAVPFVTYGRVSSGIGLYEMGKALSGKGLKILGAGKILAVHSMMWNCNNPFGQGHPDRDDESMIKNMVKAVHGKILKSISMKALTPEDLDYQSKTDKEKFNQADILTTKKAFPPMTFDVDLCNQCMECKTNCPAQNISFKPDLRYGDMCILCYNCVRYCEAGALKNDIFNVIEEGLRSRASEFSEIHETRMFY